MPNTALKFLLVGNCVVDQVFSLPRFPHEDEEMRALHSFRTLGGNACNSAQILRQLRQDVHVMTTLASDEAASWILQKLTSIGINTHLCQSLSQGCTPMSSIWLNQQNASRTIVHHRDLEELSLQQLGRINGIEFDWIHFEGRNVENLRKIVPDLYAQGIKLSLEIEKQRDNIEELLPYFNTIVVSESYLKQRKCSTDQLLEEFQHLNSTARLVCTLGDRGLVAIDSNRETINLPAQPVARVVDTRGAGDCFIAGLINQLAQQHTLSAALDYAVKLAAQKIQREGMTIQQTL